MDPVSSSLRTLRFGRIHFDARGEKYSSENNGWESVLDILGGSCSIRIESDSCGQIEYDHIGLRKDVFSGKATMVYLPSRARYTIVSETESLDIAVVEAPSNLVYSPVLVIPENVVDLAVGAGNWQRRVHIGVGPDVNAVRLMVGETFNPSGNWSGYPPHKHDATISREAAYEELYFFLLNPPQGFGLIRIYSNKANRDSKAFDKAYVIQNGDVIAIPRGYHCLTVAPGYQLFYLWALSGEGRQYGQWSDDQEHAWIKNCEVAQTGVSEIK